MLEYKSNFNSILLKAGVLMKKRFYRDASIAVIGSSLIAIVVSLVLFFTDLYYRDGGAETLISFLGYLTDVFNALTVFIGFATIIYAFFKFDFYEGVMSCLIFAASFVPYFIYHATARFVYTRTEFVDAGMIGDFDVADALLMSIYQAMGSGVINQILPSILVAFIACKVIKMSKREPTKFISFENKLQKSMIVSCISLTAINIVMFVLTGVLPSALSDYIFVSQEDFNVFIGSIVLEILKLLIIYLVVAYIVFMLMYRFYNYRLAQFSSNSALKKERKKSTIDDEPEQAQAE